MSYTGDLRNAGYQVVADILTLSNLTVSSNVIVRGGVEVDTLEMLMPVVTAPGVAGSGGEALRFDTGTAATGANPIMHGGYTQFGGQCWTGAASVFGAGMRLTPRIDTQVAGVPATYHLEIGDSAGVELWRIAQDGAVTMTGALAMGTHKITGMTNGTAADDAAAFGQIPAVAGVYLPLAGGTMAGGIVLANSATAIRSGDYTMQFQSGILTTAGADVGYKFDVLTPGLGAAGDDLHTAWTDSTANMMTLGLSTVNAVKGATLNVYRSGIGATATTALLLANATAATVGVPVQMSPRNVWSGSAFNSGGAGSVETHAFRAHVLPVTSATLTTASLDFGYAFNGGSFGEMMSLKANAMNALYGATLTITRPEIRGASTVYDESGSSNGLMLVNPTITTAAVPVQVSPAFQQTCHGRDTDRGGGDAASDDEYTWRIVSEATSGADVGSTMKIQFSRKQGAGARSQWYTQLTAISEAGAGWANAFVGVGRLDASVRLYSSAYVSAGTYVVAGTYVSAQNGKLVLKQDTMFGVASQYGIMAVGAATPLHLVNDLAGVAGTEIAIRLGNNVAMATAGQKLLSAMNATVEKAYIDWDGAYVVPKTAITALTAPSVTGPVASDGILLTNWNSGATATQQFSPSLRLDGVGYTAAATYTRQSWAITNKPTSATAGEIAFDFATGGGAWAKALSLTGTGELTTAAGITATTGNFNVATASGTYQIGGGGVLFAGTVNGVSGVPGLWGSGLSMGIGILGYQTVSTASNIAVVIGCQNDATGAAEGYRIASFNNNSGGSGTANVASVDKNGVYWNAYGSVRTTGDADTFIDIVTSCDVSSCYMLDVWVECADDQAALAKAGMWRHSIKLTTDAAGAITVQSDTAVGTDYALGGVTQVYDLAVARKMRIKVNGVAATNVFWKMFANVRKVGYVNLATPIAYPMAA